MSKNPRIGPHEEIELELMRSNRKKIALFDFFPPEFEDPVKFGEIKLKLEQVDHKHLNKKLSVYIFFLPNEELSADKLFTLIQIKFTKEEIDLELEREIGYLLGYERKDIEHYIKYISKKSNR
ncbi:hypothetical protein ACE01U_11150 [Acinetobacter sp. BSP-153]|uniref:hypothetical protein n=1 Tax=Acinetobacter sp. BSP-153 TaxID=3344663 RepID=UPI00376F95B0